MSNFGHMSKDIFKNEQKNRLSSTGSRYNEEIKQFAISLHFYSPKAYKFVRKSLHLPHPSTIRSWASSIDCEPGFLKNVIDHLQDTLEDDNKDCIILVDEMAIKKKFYGMQKIRNLLAILIMDQSWQKNKIQLLIMHLLLWL